MRTKRRTRRQQTATTPRRHRVLTRPKVRTILSAVLRKEMTAEQAAWTLGWPRRLFNRRLTRFAETQEPEPRREVRQGARRAASAPTDGETKPSRTPERDPELAALIDAGASFMARLVEAHAASAEIRDLRRFMDERQRRAVASRQGLANEAARVLERVGAAPGATR